MVRAVEVKPLPACRLQVRFSDGLEGEYAVEPDRRGGAFQQLCDPAVFDAVRINEDFGCIEWPCGIDLCPNAMHAEVASVRARCG